VFFLKKLNRGHILGIVEVLSLGGVCIFYPVGIELFDLSPHDLHRTVDHMVLLGERLRKNGDGGGKPPFGEESFAGTALSVGIDL